MEDDLSSIPNSSYGLRGCKVTMTRCCFTSTETARLIRDGEPRTATSTFTQLLSSGNTEEDDR